MRGSPAIASIKLAARRVHRLTDGTAVVLADAGQAERSEVDLVVPADPGDDLELLEMMRRVTSAHDEDATFSDRTRLAEAVRAAIVAA